MNPEQLAELARQAASARSAQPQGGVDLAALAQQAKAARPRGLGATIYDNVIGNPDDGVTSYGESLGTWMNRAGESMTLGTVGDEASAAATSMLPGRSYDGELNRYRENEEGMSTAGRLSADIFGAVVPAALGVGAVSRAPSLGRQIMTGAGLGGGAGFTQGFAEGEGGLAPRLTSGFVGGGVGMTLGAAIPGVAEVGRQGVRAVMNGMRESRIGSQLGQSLGVSPEAGRFMANVVGGEDATSMQGAFNRAGPDAMLADGSPALAGRLDATMRSPVPGAGLARGRVEQRAGQSYHNTMNALDGGQQGPRLPPVAAERQLAASAKPAVNDAYKAAYSNVIDYSSPQGMRIEALVNRLPKGQARRAIEAANDRMIYDGSPASQIMAQIADDGSVTFQEMPNVMQLDYIKRAFDGLAEDGKDAITGRLSSDGAFASRIAKDIREATADAAPDYRAALSTASGDIRERAAVRTGSTLLRPNTTVEDAAEAIAGATPAEIRAMQTGVRGQIDHVLGNVRAVGSDVNIEPRQALEALRQLSSPNSKRKMEALYGDQWPTIKESIDQATAAIGLRGSTAANSATAARLISDREITESVTPGSLRQGKPLDAGKNFIGGMTGASPDAIARMRDEVKGEVADLLTRQNGAPQEITQSALRALMANPMRTNAGRGTGNALMMGGATSLPALTQLLTGLLAGTQ